MTKDFKKQAASDGTFSQYGMGWMLGGIAIGLLVGFGLYAMNKDKPAVEVTASASDTAIIPAVVGTPVNASVPLDAANNPTLRDTASSEPDADEKPGFSYHAVLPQLEVGVPIVVPESAVVVANKDPKPKPEAKSVTKPAATPTFGKVNGFQLGSYKTETQAASLQARARSSGLNSRIEQADVNGTMMYRVRIGPATDQAMLDKWQKTLSGMGITPLAVRM
ncbi:SPOR domain-containing protein [Candidatus Thiothrix anitrata]|uniref:SPOR domain-containing protein n=1 Tax=Candidatus Thiothrix anitrata TaxID=2823902 RepID=A0ABX7X3H9_9GAMM|nr:SPOR domain-containing protein [Candidatus Thiothrix anitrata]QTR50452.1 SPOR domain-containing protein [Candidatus Thiothrix anitrata]